MYSLESDAAPVPAPRGAISLNTRWLAVGEPRTVPGGMLATVQPPVRKFSLVSLWPPMVLARAPPGMGRRPAQAAISATTNVARFMGHSLDGLGRRGKERSAAEIEKSAGLLGEGAHRRQGEAEQDNRGARPGPPLNCGRPPARARRPARGPAQARFMRRSSATNR